MNAEMNYKSTKNDKEELGPRGHSLEKKESQLVSREDRLKQIKIGSGKHLTNERVQELERISGLTSEQAKEYLLKLLK